MRALTHIPTYSIFKKFSLSFPTYILKVSTTSIKERYIHF